MAWGQRTSLALRVGARELALASKRSRSARSGGVLHVANALLHAALDLLCLAFGLLRLIAGQLAEPLLGFACDLVDGAFGPFAGHLDTPVSYPAHVTVNVDGSFDPGPHRRLSRG